MRRERQKYWGRQKQMARHFHWHWQTEKLTEIRRHWGRLRPMARHWLKVKLKQKDLLKRTEILRRWEKRCQKVKRKRWGKQTLKETLKQRERRKPKGLLMDCRWQRERPKLIRKHW